MEKEKEGGRHQVHVTLPLDIYNRTREVLNGSPLSVLIRRLLIRYLEIYDTAQVKSNRVDKVAFSVLKEDIEKCVIDEKEV